MKRWRPDDDSSNDPKSTRRSSLKDKISSSSPSSASASASSASPSTTNGTKGKTVLKLPGGAFGNRQQQQQPQPQHVKAIRLKAVDKQNKKRSKGKKIWKKENE